MTADKTKRINVTFPVALLEELRDKLPRRERNSFIVMATERELRRLKVCEVLRHLHEHGPIWSDEDHPDLMTVEDVDRHVRGMRESYNLSPSAIQPPHKAPGSESTGNKRSVTIS